MFYKIVLIAVTGIITVNIVKEFKSEFALPVSIAIGIVILKLLINEMYKIKSDIMILISDMNIDSDIVLLCFEICALTIAKSFICNLCIDYGHRSIADKVDLAARIAMISLCIPWLKQLLININKLL